MAIPYFAGDIDYGRFIQASFAFSMVEGSLFFVVNQIEELAKCCDVISLHVHVTNETTKMINRSFLSNCIPSVLIVNTSRGEIVNEEELIEFLKSNPRKT